MPTYSNGNVPYGVVSVVLDSGTDENGYYEFRCTPAFAARWAFAKKYAETHFGTTIHIRPGWNIYRPIESQRVARANACDSGNCAGAAYPGYSSHGGNWNGRDCLAVDVDPNGLTWSQVDEAMTAAGFAAGLITSAISSIPGGEPWHYIDFNAFGPVPAGLNATPFQEDDMFTDDDRNKLANVYAAIFAGGPDMPDGGRSIGAGMDNLTKFADRIDKTTQGIAESVSPIFRDDGVVSLRQEVADAKTNTLTLLGRPAGEVKVDASALAAAVASALAAALTSNQTAIIDEIKKLPAETITALKTALG